MLKELYYYSTWHGTYVLMAGKNPGDIANYKEEMEPIVHLIWPLFIGIEHIYHASYLPAIILLS